MSTEENKKPHNQSAFPTIEQHGDLQTWSNYEGMTLRDYFAAKAMQGLMSNPDWMVLRDGNKYLMQSSIAAEVSYKISDAMLKARENV